MQVRTALLIEESQFMIYEFTYRHVGHRSYPGRKAVSACLCLATNPEISKLHYSILVKQNVSWFDISMHNVLLVQVGEALQYLHSY